MADMVVESLILDLLEWIALRERTYEEVMAAKPPFDPTKPYEVLRPPIDYPRAIALSLMPPGLLLFLGCAGWWVLRGFRA